MITTFHLFAFACLRKCQTNCLNFGRYNSYYLKQTKHKNLVLLHFFFQNWLREQKNEQNRQTSGHCLLNLLILFHCPSLPSTITYTYIIKDQHFRKDIFYYADRPKWEKQSLGQVWNRSHRLRTISVKLILIILINQMIQRNRKVRIYITKEGISKQRVLVGQTKTQNC